MLWSAGVARFSRLAHLFQEFEEALIDDCGFERNIVIVHLLQKLLKAFVIRSIE